MPDAIERVGLGVDLIGGDSTLAQLKAIRAEMTAIAGLGRSSSSPSGSIYGPSQQDVAKAEQNLKAIEKAQMDSIQRVAKAKAEVSLRIDPDEPKIYNDRIARRREVERQAHEQTKRQLLDTTKEVLKRESIHKRISDRGAMEREAQREKELRGYARLRQVLDENTRKNRADIIAEGQLREAELRKYAALRKRLATEMSQDPSAFIGRDPTLRNRLRAVRNDAYSRSDPTTSSWRDETALELRALRIKRDRQREYDAEEIRKAEAQAKRLEAIELRRQYGARQRNLLEFRRGQEEARRLDPQIGKQIDLADRLLAVNAPSKQGRGGGTGYLAATGAIQNADVQFSNKARSLQTQFRDLAQRTQQFKNELLDVDRTRPLQVVAADLRAIQREQEKVIRGIQEIARANAQIPSSQRNTLAGLTPGGGGPPRGPRRGGGGPGGPGGGGPRLTDPQGLFNEKGFFTTGDAVGRITRNILLYEVVSRATYGLVNYTQEAITAAKATVEYANALRFATEQAGGDIGANERLADSLQELGLSRQQGRKAVTEAARFASDRPQDTAAITRIGVNIAASRGLGIDKADELIEQLRRGESKFFKRQFGTTVEGIYESYAAQQVDRNTTPRRGATADLFIGDKSKILSRSDEIKKYLADMGEAEKETARFNFILNQSSKFEGEAAERALTLAGRLDKVAAAFLNAQEGVGLFITELKPVNDLLDLLVNKAGILDKLKPPTVNRSGEGGTITNADVRQYATDRTTGGRAALLNEINTFGTPGALGGLALGATALIGRQQAQQAFRSAEYQKNFTRLATEFNGNLTAAQNEAVRVTKDLRPGFVRSVGQGMSRLTTGVSDSVRSTLGFGALPSSFIPPTYGAFSPQAAAINQQFVRPGQSGRLSGVNPSIVQGAFSPLLGRNDIRDLGRIQSFGQTTGGIVGGVGGAMIGSLIAEKLEVGPITATGLTIAGGIAGTTIGTAIGTTIATGITSYIAGAGGFGKLLASIPAIGAAGTAISGAASTVGATVAAGGGFGALASAPLGAGLAAGGTVTAITATLASIVGVLGLAAGGIIGAGINYLNPNDPLSREQKTLDRQVASDEIEVRRKRELETAKREGLVRYRDLQPGTGFNQLLSEREARQRGGLELGFTGPQRRYEEVTLTGNDPRIKAKDKESIERQRLDVEAQITTAYANRQEIEEELTRLRAKDPTLEENKYIKDAIAPLEHQITLYEKLNDLKAKGALIDEYGTLDPEKIKKLSEYRTKVENDEIERNRKEEEARQKRQAKRDEKIGEMNNALAKLRDASSGSFRLVGDIGQIVAGPDNEFVQILADQATAAERMALQWGFLGEAAVEYFTILENRALNRKLNLAEFGAYKTSTDLISRAAQERDTRGDPTTFSRREQEYLSIQSAIVDRAREIPNLWRQAAEVLGQANITPGQELEGRINLLSQSFGVSGFRRYNALGEDVSSNNIRYNAAGQSLGGYFDTFQRTNDEGQSLEDPQARLAFLNIGRGQSTEVTKALQKSFADTIIEAFQGYTPAQIKGSGLQDYYLGAIQVQRASLDDTIIQARQKADLGAREDARLKEQLVADERFRAEQLAKGRDVKDVGRESDRLLLARTEGIAPKDLTFDQFQNRQEALRREADRATSDQEDAKKAVAQGLEYQRTLNLMVDQLRAAVLGGNVSALITIQNDATARTDRDALQNVSNENVPLDQRGVRGNPYTPSTAKFKRPGQDHVTKRWIDY